MSKAFPLKFKVKSPVHALELARQLIRPFRRWTTGVLAEAEIGTGEIPPKSARAEAFCALGALERVNTKHAKKAKMFLARAAAIFTDGEDSKECWMIDNIFDVNDNGRIKETHCRVLKMFTKAIHLAKAEGR